MPLSRWRLIGHGAHQKTLGADKNYDTKGMVAELRRIGVTPHLAQNNSRPGGCAIDRRTTCHQGYTNSSKAHRMWASRRYLAGSNIGALCASSSCAASTR